MNKTVYWVLEVAINEGQVDEFRTLMDEMVESTKASEPETLNYEWSISEDHKSCHIVEQYQDSAAAMIHLKSFGENFAARFMALASPSRFVVYGAPNDVLKSALAGFGASFMTPFGGFSR